ncbi:hypothetical protein KM043_005336 [Ampulex compressa]|nr:hypothetical protein KM043_005336 [Ampulex compressa]
MLPRVKVLDGGFSTQLSTHIKDKIDGDPLWTARFLATMPDAIFATHLDFLRAGADIILTNTYQASINGFAKHLNLSREDTLNLFCKSVEYAKEAIYVYQAEIKGKHCVLNQNPLIAGSCGPYGACLHDASEYTGIYCTNVSREILMDWHRPRIKALVDSGVDMLAIETIPCKLEAEALIHLLKEFPNTKAWMSFSCRDDGKSIADGTSFQEIAIKCFRKATPGQLLAVGVNCIAPQNVTPLIDGMNGTHKTDFIPLVVYPNSGEKYTVADGWKREGKWYPLQQFVGEWLDLGVKMHTNVSKVVHIK